jgi:hypothetical protein
MTDSGDRAWAIMFAWVIAYDRWAIRNSRPTMSASFFRASRHPFQRWFVLGGWAYLTAHLVRAIPEWLDPLRTWGRRCSGS